MNFTDNWKSLLAQQSVATGRPISPRQAMALRQGYLAEQYQNTNEREKAALARESIDNRTAYQEGSLALGRDRLAMSGDQFNDQMALRYAQLNSQKALQDSKLDILTQEYNNREQANMIKGIVSLPVAGMGMYSLYKNSGMGDTLSGFFDSVLDWF
jgi:hypothetical protein